MQALTKKMIIFNNKLCADVKEAMFVKSNVLEKKKSTIFSNLPWKIIKSKK